MRMHIQGDYASYELLAEQYFVQLKAMYPKVYLYKRIEDAKILIDRNYTEPIKLDQIAERVYLSKYHFLRLFKEAYGTSPHQYLIRKRIDRAKQLLSKGLPVSSVCYEIGFESVQSFSNLFKRHTGVSPGKYSPLTREVE